MLFKLDFYLGNNKMICGSRRMLQMQFKPKSKTFNVSLLIFNPAFGLNLDRILHIQIFWTACVCVAVGPAVIGHYDISDTHSEQEQQSLSGSFLL